MSNNIYQSKVIVSNYNISRIIPESVVDDYVQKIIAITNPSFICDAGCGTGYVLNSFNKFHKFVFGVDQSEEMVKIAGSNAYKANIEDLVSITKFKPDLIHIKAVTHIPLNPENLLDSILFSVADKGYVVIGAENSQPEDALENICLYKGKSDYSLRDFYLKYFSLREFYKIPFLTPKMPAGNYTNARDYLLDKGAIFVDEIESVFWKKELTFSELLDAMNIGTFSVFRRGVNNKLRNKIVKDMREYCLEKNYDLDMKRTYAANLRAVILQKEGQL